MVLPSTQLQKVCVTLGFRRLQSLVKRSVLSVFINLRYAECVCLHYGLEVHTNFSQNNFLNLTYLFVCEQTRSLQYEHTLSAERRSMETDKTERFTRHWNRRNHRFTVTFCNCVEGRTTGLLTHS